MKSNSKHIPVLLLALFFCAISLHNASALTRNFQKGQTVTFSVKKRLKFNAAPIHATTGTEAGLFDKEAEDKKETAFAVALPVFDYASSFDTLIPVKFLTGSFSFDKKKINVHQPLFLVLHSIRV